MTLLIKKPFMVKMMNVEILAQSNSLLFDESNDRRKTSRLIDAFKITLPSNHINKFAIKTHLKLFQNWSTSLEFFIGVIREVFST